MIFYKYLVLSFVFCGHQHFKRCCELRTVSSLTVLLTYLLLPFYDVKFLIWQSVNHYITKSLYVKVYLTAKCPITLIRQSHHGKVSHGKVIYGKMSDSRLFTLCNLENFTKVDLFFSIVIMLGHVT